MFRHVPQHKPTSFPPGGEGADAAIDCVGGQLVGDIVSAVRPGGSVMSFGSLAGQNEKLQVSTFVWNWAEAIDDVPGVVFTQPQLHFSAES